MDRLRQQRDRKNERKRQRERKRNRVKEDEGKSKHDSNFETRRCIFRHTHTNKVCRSHSPQTVTIKFTSRRFYQI